MTDWDMEHPEVISPDGGKEGFPAAKEEDNGKYFFVPKMCNHCADSPCTQVCPVGATFISPDGVVLVDQTYCLGCAYCVQACPYGCLYTLPERKVADKCTLRYHRITKGLTTARCEACPTGAREVAVISMRWNVVIGGQLFSKSFVGYTTYKMSLVTRKGLLMSIALLILPLGILWVLVKLLPPWPDQEPAALHALSKPVS